MKMKTLLKRIAIFLSQKCSLLLFALLLQTSPNYAQCTGNAIQFDGVDDYVNAGVQASLEMSSAITMEAWIYPTGPGSQPQAGGIIINREGEYEIARFEDGTIRLAIANTSPGWRTDWDNTGYVAPLNVWTHIALTYSAAARIIKVYANGTEIYSLPGSGDIGDYPDLASEDEFRIGGRQHAYNTNQIFQGIIDEVRIWKVAVSQSIIQQWMNKSVNSDHPDFTNLAGYWKFDEGNGSTTADASGNGNMGTLTNLPT